jgi:hypothetical protein
VCGLFAWASNSSVCASLSTGCTLKYQLLVQDQKLQLEMPHQCNTVLPVLPNQSLGEQFNPPIRGIGVGGCGLKQTDLFRRLGLVKAWRGSSLGYGSIQWGGGGAVKAHPSPPFGWGRLQFSVVFSNIPQCQQSLAGLVGPTRGRPPRLCNTHYNGMQALVGLAPTSPTDLRAVSLLPTNIAMLKTKRPPK